MFLSVSALICLNPFILCHPLPLITPTPPLPLPYNFSKIFKKFHCSVFYSLESFTQQSCDTAESIVKQMKTETAPKATTFLKTE